MARDAGDAGETNTDGGGTTTGTDGDEDRDSTDGGTETRSREPTRYHGHVRLDPVRYKRDFDRAAEEVIDRLSRLDGCEVSITIEIEAHRSSGFDDAIQRTILENGRALKFDGSAFEEA
jgi:hypothetical protein